MWPFRRRKIEPLWSTGAVVRRLAEANAALKVELAAETSMRVKLGELYAKKGAEADDLRKALTDALAELADLRPYKERVDALAREVLAVKAEREEQADLIGRAEGSASRCKARLLDCMRELREAEATVDGLGIKLATFERAEDAAYEAKAKRRMDGQGDDR